MLWLPAVLLLAGCAPAPPPRPVEPPKPDPTTESWYGETVTRLAAMHREAAALVRKGQSDRAAAIITEGQPLLNRVLSAPRPTLAAMEAASDLDDLYGRMLLANRHYGWARLLFQKNQKRWSAWQPRTADTERRLKDAVAAIAECDGRLGE